jgi:hypothetical protein
MEDGTGSLTKIFYLGRPRVVHSALCQSIAHWIKVRLSFLLTVSMNAKVKVLAAIAAVQLMVPMVFAQGPVVIQGPAIVEGSVYQITGRVIEVDPSRIVIRSRGANAGEWVILRRNDTRFYAQVRPGDMVSIKYNMMATDVTPLVPVAPRVVPPRYR